ncbi:unnamed protein product [Caenorhabditis bovis]|uniref:MAM domain-containing protein n=1 Tax=Caenorhabditis bovis TaxID=2654633 RepID=A0A8S1F254_9PELO|nr:unnamed protein product [Caenorhabditis bovis]
MLCSFEQGDCGWLINPPWNIVGLALIPSDQGVTKPIRAEGPFLLAQGKYGSVSSSRSTSQRLQNASSLQILAFRFQKHGSARLRVLLVNGSSELLLDSINSDEIVGEWRRRSVVLPPVSSNSKIVFECSNVRTAGDLLGIDDVEVYTPSNVVSSWAGLDSNLFNKTELNNREIRRKPIQTTKFCKAIRCPFRSTSCQWKTSNMQLLPTKIVNEASGESVLTSPTIRAPSGAHLLIQLFDSPKSMTTVFAKTIGMTTEKEIWRKTEELETKSAQGWNRILIPIESPMPVSIKIVSSTAADDFVAFASVDLVDKNGEPIDCESLSSPIQPQPGNLVRLTALQNLKISPLEKLLYQPPIGHSNIATLPPVSFNIDEPRHAVLPISPAQVSARGVPIVPLPMALPILQFQPSQSPMRPKNPFSFH